MKRLLHLITGIALLFSTYSYGITKISNSDTSLNQYLAEQANMGQIDKVQELINEGADVNAEVISFALLNQQAQQCEGTVLTHAALGGHYDMIIFLIRNGADAKKSINICGLNKIEDKEPFKLIKKSFIEDQAAINCALKILPKELKHIIANYRHSSSN